MNRPFQFLLSAVLMLAATRAGAQATIEGKVALPKPTGLATAPPRYAGQAGEIAPPPPPTAVIYLEGKFEQTTNSAAPKPEVWQQGAQFSPGVLPVQVGTSVEFPNADAFYHNVFSYSKTKRFDLGRYRKEDATPPKQVFDKAGVVKLRCEIHEHMQAVILVLDTPHFTATTNGTFKLTGLPAGKFTLKAWLDEKTVLEKPVDLVAGQTLQADFTGK